VNTLYITDHGLMLKKRSDRIAVKKGNSIIEEIPILDLKRVLIFGNNQVSTELLRHLSSKGIEVSFLSSSGRFQFRIVPKTSKNIYLRMAQHRFYENQAFRVDWSRKIVEAKIKNQRNLMLRVQKNQPGKDLSDSIDRLDQSIRGLPDKRTVEEIMGAEGYASTVYFSAFAHAIIKDDFRFEKRGYYPPPDPVNALLSFGYMLVFNELSSLLEAFGFDTYLGFLHGTRYGRESLATDMIEEFRSPVVDRLVLYLINLGAIKPSQFNTLTNKGVNMDEKAKKVYLKNYEKFMTASFVGYNTRERTTFRDILRKNAIQLERFLLNNEKYRPFIFYA